MDLQREEDELIEKLKNVMDYLEDQPAAQGITKQIIGKGFNSLSENQTLVFERYIHPVINQYHSNCEQCGILVFIEDPLIEQIETVDDEIIYICEGCYPH